MAGARSTLRALYATAVRALRFYFRYRFQAVMLVFNSLIWLPPFYFLGQAFAVDGRIPGLAAYTGIDDYATFLVVGWIVAAYVYSAFWAIGFTLAWEMMGGTLEVNWLAPVPRWVLIVGNSIPDLIRTTISSSILLVVAWFGLDIRFTPEAARAALLLAPALVGLYGIGFAVGALVLVVKDPSNIVDMVSYFTNVLAGDRLPPAALPVPLFALSLAIPLTYAYDGLRHAVLGTTPILPFALEAVILVIFAVGMTTLGLWALGAADRRSRRLGTLAHH